MSNAQHALARASRTRRLVLLTVGGLGLALAITGVAWAFWTSTGSGTATATTGTLNQPTSVVATTTAGNSMVGVTWSAPSGGASPTGYYVTRINTSNVSSAACGTSPAAPTASLSCNDTGVADGTYTYKVTAVIDQSWTATSASSPNVTVTAVVLSVTINQTAAQADPTNTQPINFTAVFSAAVTDFADTDVSIGGSASGTKTAVVTGSGTTYNIAISGATGPGTVTASIAANAAHNGGGGGNTASTSTDNSVSYDAVPPTVAGVSSTTANGAYPAGTVIPIAVTFSKTVTVTGTPLLTVSTGSPLTTAVSYASGSGSAVLTFNYTVAVGNSSADLDYASTAALALNGGTIKDAAGNNATLTLAAPAAAGSLGANNSLVIDTVAPTVTGVTSTTANGTYPAGTVIPITVAFSESVTVAGTPQLTLSTGTPATTAVNYASGSGTNVLTFNYTVAAGNSSPDLDYATTSALTLNGGSIKDAAGNGTTLILAAPTTAGSLGANKNLIIDAVAPTVTGVTSTTANGTYAAGTIIPITVTFTKPVIVTGTPQLTLTTGTPVTTAVSYLSGGGTSVLTFRYTVAASNTSTDLDYASTGALGLNGGTIKDAATNNATLTLAAPGNAGSLGANRNLKIDTVGPTLTSVSSGGGTAGKMESGDIITLTFDEALDPLSVPTSVTVKEERSGSSTLTIPGLIVNVGIANGYLGGNGASGTATGTVVLSSGNTVITVTLGSVTLAGNGVGTGSGAVNIMPATALTDVAGNASLNTPATLSRLF
jgi:hypothetical protein